MLQEIYGIIKAYFLGWIIGFALFFLVGFVALAFS